MKKIILSLIACFALTIGASAQIMKTEELEKYAKHHYGDKWVSAAENIASDLELDKNGSLTYQRVIECGNLTKEQLYVALNYWFTATFNEESSTIRLNDKELGAIIAEGFVSNVVSHVGGVNLYRVNIRPVIRADIKDQKVRITYTLQAYDVDIYEGGGVLGILADDQVVSHKEKWGLDTCYPFAKKDQHIAKKTSSKALVMAHAYSKVIMDKIEESVKNGLIGNDNDDW